MRQRTLLILSLALILLGLAGGIGTRIAEFGTTPVAQRQAVQQPGPGFGGRFGPGPHRRRFGGFAPAPGGRPGAPTPPPSQ